MILVTGATGNLGTGVLKQLQTHLKKKEYIVSSSSEKGVEGLINRGFNARLADFNNQDSLQEAFNGVTKILLISTMDQNRFQQHKNVIDVAQQKGVQNIIYTSLAIKDIQASAVKELMGSHFETEEYLINSGINYTILRNTMYADALVQILGQKALSSDIKLPGGTGKVPYALRSEMGEAIANLLVSDGHHNEIYDIVGSQSYSYEDIAKELQKISGLKIQYKDISEEQFSTNLRNIGFPDFAIYLHAGTIKDIKNHQYEIKSSALQELLGRPTAGITDFLKEIFNLK